MQRLVGVLEVDEVKVCWQGECLGTLSLACQLLWCLVGDTCSRLCGLSRHLGIESFGALCLMYMLGFPRIADVVQGQPMLRDCAFGFVVN